MIHLVWNQLQALRTLILKAREGPGGSRPFDDEADPVALVQDALELGNAVGAGPLEGDLVGNADDLHRSGVARDLPVGNRNHVIQAQRLGCGGGEEGSTVR